MAPSIPTYDYYAVLEVLPSATYEEMKTSYRRLALLHHPDKNNGSQNATVKIHQINEAWGILQDRVTRTEYDTRYHARTSTSNPRRPNTSKPTSTPHPRCQPPRPSPRTTAKSETKAKLDSQKKRREWLIWEIQQEQSIRQRQRQVELLEAAIAALNAKVKDNRAKLAGDTLYSWSNPMSSSPKLTEAEKNEIQRQILDSDAAIRIKQVLLDNHQSRLQPLKDVLSRRRDQEYRRVAAETKRKEGLARNKAAAEAKRQENLARDKDIAEAKRKHAEQEAARKRATTEEQRRYEEQKAAEEKAAIEALRRYAEQQSAHQAAWEKSNREKMAREEAVRKEATREEAAREEINRRNKEAEQGAAFQKLHPEVYIQWKKMEQMQRQLAAELASLKKRQTELAQRLAVEEQQAKAEEEAKQRQRQRSHCYHKFWWNKVSDTQNCPHCTTMLHGFAQQCPGCFTIACYPCMRMLKADNTP